MFIKRALIRRTSKAETAKANNLKPNLRKRSKIIPLMLKRLYNIRGVFLGIMPIRTDGKIPVSDYFILSYYKDSSDIEFITHFEEYLVDVM